MLLHDVAISGLHVVLAVDRAGLVGEDGETHHGLFDVAYLTSIPGMTVLTPGCFQELRQMLDWAVDQCPGPVAIRYPRGGEGAYQGSFDGQKTLRLKRGQGITLVTYGPTGNDLLAASEALDADVFKLQTIAPVDWAPILDSARATGRVLLAEECASQGSVGQQLAAQLALNGVKVNRLTLCNTGPGFVTHGRVDDLRKLCGLDVDSLAQRIGEAMAP